MRYRRDQMGNVDIAAVLHRGGEAVIVRPIALNIHPGG